MKIQEKLSKAQSELSRYESQLAQLQAPDPEPKLREFGNAQATIIAHQEWQKREAAKPSEIAAIAAILPDLRAKIPPLEKELETVKAKVDKHFEEFSKAALEANKALEMAQQKIDRVLELSQGQGLVGHQQIYDQHHYYSQCEIKLGVFVVNKVGNPKITLMSKEQYSSLVGTGHAGAVLV